MSADLPARVVQFLHLNSRPDRPLRLGVAVSGGADSVTLLHLLHAQPTLVGQLTVLHVNHGLRGFDSQNDEAFVRDLAASLNLPVEVHHGPPAPGNLEAEARRVRRGFFFQARRQLDLNFIALGHTASDQAETVLFRLIRGSGLRGLGGMAPVTPVFLRPLLTSSRDEVRDYARAHDIRWREDLSNGDMHLRRNWLRSAILPQLQDKLNPKLESTLGVAAEVARDEEAFWLRKISQLLKRSSKPFRQGPDLVLDAAHLRRLHPAIQRRLVRGALEQLRGGLYSIDISHVQAILDLLDVAGGHARVQVPGGDILRSFDSLLFARPETLKAARDFCLHVPVNTDVQLPFGVGMLRVCMPASESENCVNVKEIEEIGLLSAEEYDLDADVLDSRNAGQTLQVRNWQSGDSILLPDSTHPVKLKTLFGEGRVVLWERRHWPVLVVDNEIAWTRRFGFAASFAATAQSRRLCRICFRPAASGNAETINGR